MKEIVDACILVTDEGIGNGPEDLRIAMMKAFLGTLVETSPLPGQLIFITNGVKLVCSGSDVIDDIRALESAGVTILACGTCLKYFDIMNEVEVGKVSNMFEISETLLRAGHVVRV
ncbi:MAG: sulfurtransferase-like selenium metabolism protein YedF [Candidatus Glassbacteria bacterium]